MNQTTWIRSGVLVTTTAVGGVLAGCATDPVADPAPATSSTMIGNDGDTVARTRMMRTAPLWGLRFRTRFLHDGRTSDLTTAILAHDGQAKASRDAFNALSSADKNTLLTGLKAL